MITKTVFVMLVALISLCASLGLIVKSNGSSDASRPRQGSPGVQSPDCGAAPSIGRHKATRQAERQRVEQAHEKDLKNLAQGFAGLIAGPSPTP